MLGWEEKESQITGVHRYGCVGCGWEPVDFIFYNTKQALYGRGLFFFLYSKLPEPTMYE
jgi:hypothetical protein